MRNHTKKRLAALGTAFALLLAMSLTFAYFTDRVEVSASVTGGTVGLSQSQTWPANLQAGPQNLDNINPGDSRSLAFTVTNTGNKAIDVRHIIKLYVEDAAGNPKELSLGEDVSKHTLLQFDLYKASDVVTMSGTDTDSYNAGYVLKDGALPVFSSDSVNSTTKMGASRDLDNIEKGIVTYYFADSVLDGVNKNAETGYSDSDHNAAALKDTGIATLSGTTAVDYNYILIFRDTTLNDFQGCKLTVELVVEGKQHLNTMSSWQNIETVTYEMDVGQDAQNTTIYTAPNNQTGVLEDVTDSTADTYNENTAH